MNLPEHLADSLSAARAKVVVGYPWWLRPWLARDVVAITLGRTIYLADRFAHAAEEPLMRLVRHELAHVRQVNRLGLPVFLARYLWEFARNLGRLRSFRRAYDEISFEVEARGAEESETSSGL
jgi:hypothetical protein